MSEYLDPTITNLVVLSGCAGRMVAPGDSVLIVGDHPHTGRLGTYLGVDVLATGGAACKVDFGSDGCYVFNASQWEKFFWGAS